VTPEADLERIEHGIVPASPGWFVLNARDAPWRERSGRGYFCEFESPLDDRASFEQLGINIQVLAPGEPMAVYHWERDQEDFLVVAGEALLIVEGEERTLGAWDLVHCPPGTNHTIVGAGARPCVIVAMGAREHGTAEDWGAYTVAPAAIRHGAGVEAETGDPAEAYGRFGPSRLTSSPDGLPPC
jgi:uncharacterized cupin superfamily protein